MPISKLVPMEVISSRKVPHPVPTGSHSGWVPTTCSMGDVQGQSPLWIDGATSLGVIRFQCCKQKCDRNESDDVTVGLADAVTDR